MDYRYQNDEPNRIYLNKQDIQRYLSPLRNNYISLQQFKDSMEYRLAKYWNQIYKIKQFKDFIDGLLNEQKDRITLLNSSDIEQIKRVISQYGIKTQNQEDLQSKGIKAISDVQLLKRCYDNLMKQQQYDNALYIANLLMDNQLKKNVEKNRVQQLNLFAKKINSYKDLIKIISHLN